MQDRILRILGEKSKSHPAHSMRRPRRAAGHGFGLRCWVALFSTLGCLHVRARPPQVDGSQALQFVRGIVAIAPRHSGTDGARQAARWIREHCRDLGAAARMDQWEEETAHGRKTFQNVIAVIPGRSANRVIVGSHYDGKYLPDVPDFPGANDSGSSTGLLLEMIRVLADAPEPPPLTLEFAFFDGEECYERYGPKDGLHGSKRHAADVRKRLKNYVAMILLDMIGDRQLTVTLPRDSDPRLARLLLEEAAERGWERHFGWFRRGTIIDDHKPFADIGLPAINVIDFEYGPGNSYWHTPEDTMDKLSPRSLEIIGNTVMGLLWQLGEEFNTPDATDPETAPSP
mgnify:CR=1 FL=1